MSGDKAGGIGREKDRGADQLFRLSEAFHGSAQQQLLAARSSIEQRRIERRAEDAGGNGVDANPMLRQFDGERFGERYDRRLAGPVGGNLVEGDK